MRNADAASMDSQTTKPGVKNSTGSMNSVPAILAAMSSFKLLDVQTSRQLRAGAKPVGIGGRSSARYRGLEGVSADIHCDLLRRFEFSIGMVWIFLGSQSEDRRNA